jgi:hypothetical protein
MRQKPARQFNFSLIAIGLFVMLCLSMQAQPSPASSGSITGTVVDASGATITGAHVKLILNGQIPQQTTTDTDGHFSFSAVSPGSFQLTVESTGFAAQTIDGVLDAGENYHAPLIALAVASANVEVEVALTQTELAQEQLNEEEKQRLLGVIPNFYVTYDPNALPLTAKQKFSLAGKLTLDPVNFVLVGVNAGIGQASDSFHDYGQGAQGYGKRYGAALADFYSGVFIGSAVLPSLLHQDPRYFVKGTGTRRSRVLYAVGNAFIRKGDNGHWQPDYSGILGGLASGGISNIYYPARDRDGAALTFENAGFSIAGTAVGNIIQEFLFRKITPHANGSGKNP